jgi:phosphoglycerate dehydrogenase-like enzyme
VAGELRHLVARRLAEASLGFQPGRWGEPAGRSLAGTAVCVIGTGAIGVQIAYRLTAFGVTVTGIRRRDREVPPFTHVFPAGHLKTAVADADAVIIAASHQAGIPPVIDDAVLLTLRPGALLVNVARGALLDTDAALAHLRAGRLGGLGLDVYPVEPYPPDSPLLSHPRVVATAHNAALTSDYFQAASRRLGDALTRYLRHEPPADLVTRE